MKLHLFVLISLLLAGCADQPNPYDQAVAQVRADMQQESDIAQQHRELVDKARTDYLAKHPDLKPEFRQAVQDHRVLIGMPEDAAHASLGDADNYHSVQTAKGLTESWTNGSMKLVFMNGLLTEIIQ